MAVTVYQCLSPQGRIVPAIIWPGASADAVGQKITAFIVEGGTLATEDEAVKLWVYYRAKDEQYQRLIGMPAQVTDSDEGSSAYLQAQIEMVRQERDNALAEFEDAVEGGVSGGEYTVVQSLR